MYEVFPILCGFVIGLLVQWVSNSRLKTGTFVGLSLIFGTIASYISGELSTSWVYLPFDVAQVLVAACALLLFFAWQQRRIV